MSIPTSAEIAAMMPPLQNHCELCGRRWRLWWSPADGMFAHDRCRRRWLASTAVEEASCR